MFPTMLEYLRTPRPQVYLIADPVSKKMSIVLKLRLWSGTSLVGTFWLTEAWRPIMGVQLVTAMSEYMACTSPDPWRLL